MNKPTLVDQIGSFTVVPNRFIDEARVGHEAFRVFVYLRRLVNVARGDELAWPAYGAIMLGAQIGRRQNLSLALRELVETGWLTKQRRFGKPTKYTLRYPASSSDGGTTESAPVVQTSERSVVPTSERSVVPTGGTLTRDTKQDEQKQDERGRAGARSLARPYLEVIPFSDEAIELAGRAGISPRAARGKIARETQFNLSDELEALGAVFAHRQICGYVPLTAAVAIEMSQLVGANLDDWRSTLLAWMAAGWNNRNIEGQLQRFASEAKRAEARKAIEAKRSSSSSSSRYGATTRAPQIADPTDTERAASEERARQQRAERAARKTQVTA